MKPYPGKKLTVPQITFNKRLSRGRVVVECAFGQMSQRWRIFQTTIQQPPITTELIIKAACILQNVIIDLETHNDRAQPNSEAEPLTSDEENNDGQESCSGYGKEIRNELTKYFMEHSIG